MKNSLIILAFFILGIGLGISNLLPFLNQLSDLSTYVLYLLMFLVGISVGGDKKSFETLKKANLSILLIPLSTIIGSLIGASVVSLFLSNISIKESLAVGAGFGYYSLSSILITRFYSETLGVVALLANMSREIFTLLFAPSLAKHIGKLALISSGGATSMDTTLPIISLASGKEYAIIAVLHGIILTLIVPFLVTGIIQLL